MKKWGNVWTEEKLESFEKYVKAYLTILNKNKVQYGWKTIYFDGFAGSGDTGSEANNLDDSSLFEIPIEETKVYKGAAERILRLDKKFDFYYFIDLNTESLEKLKIKLEKHNVNSNLQFRAGDANSYITELAKALTNNKKLKALALLDPFGMQINWESIMKLKGTSTDIWILLPSGVIINRLLDRKGELKNISKLCSFFGMTEDEIREEFYKETYTYNLFGDIDIEIEKIVEPIKKIANLYIKKLKEIWDYVLDEPLVLKNSKNVPIFHFVFASQKINAKKIAKEIVKKKE